MKIAQFYDENVIRLGMIESDRIVPVDLSGDMIDLIKSGRLDGYGLKTPVPVEQVRFAPPVTRPSKIIALGLNYKDHAEESKGEVPDVPLIFAKFPNSLIGHRDNIKWNTTVTNKVDFEAELAVIIGPVVYKCAEIIL